MVFSPLAVIVPKRIANTITRKKKKRVFIFIILKMDIGKAFPMSDFFYFR